MRLSTHRRRRGEGFDAMMNGDSPVIVWHNKMQIDGAHHTVVHAGRAALQARATGIGAALSGAEGPHLPLNGRRERRWRQD